VYRFRASDPIDFDLHYHDGSNVVSPIRRNDVTADEAEFTALTRQRYCLRWANHGFAPVRFGYAREISGP